MPRRYTVEVYVGLRESIIQDEMECEVAIVTVEAAHEIEAQLLAAQIVGTTRYDAGWMVVGTQLTEPHPTSFRFANQIP